MRITIEVDPATGSASIIDGGGVTGGAPAPGMVRVTPTGVRARGVFRDYPARDPSQDINLWSYEMRLTRITNPATGKPYVQPGTASGYGLAEVSGEDFAISIDKKLHYVDWMNQEQSDQYDALQKRDEGHGFSPGQ